MSAGLTQPGQTSTGFSAYCSVRNSNASTDLLLLLKGGAVFVVPPANVVFAHALEFSFTPLFFKLPNPPQLFENLLVSCPVVTIAHGVALSRRPWH